MKRFLQALVLGATLAVFSTAPAAFAANPATTDSSAPSGAAHVVGRGTIATDEGTGRFRLLAVPETGRHGHRGNFKFDNGDVTYNGSVRSYSVNGTTATIEGAGGLHTKDGQKHHVRFTLTVVAGGSNQGSIDATFTGRDYNEHYAGSLTSGEIKIGSASVPAKTS